MLKREAAQDGAPISREVIAHIVALVEQDMGIAVDRTGFDFTRFSSHMQHLIRRSAEGTFLDTKNQQLYQVLVDSYPDTYCCVEHICAYLRCVLGRSASGRGEDVSDASCEQALCERGDAKQLGIKVMLLQPIPEGLLPRKRALPL
jgi:hypothetical protein